MRKLGVIGLIVLLVLMSGCIEKQEQRFFVGGNNGLVMSFLPEQPPAVVDAKDSFNIVIRLRNLGEEDISSGDVQVVLKNNRNLLGITSLEEAIKSNSAPLPGATLGEGGVIPGGEDFIEFENLRYNGGPSLTDEKDIDFSIEACYPYKTYGVATMCISRNRLQGKVCAPVGEKKISSSGAPLQITSFVQETNGLAAGKILSRIKIKVSAAGKGEFYSLDTSCPIKDTGFETEAKRNKVELLSISVGTNRWEAADLKDICENEGKIELVNGVGEIRCTLPFQDIGMDYNERIIVEIGYIHVIDLDGKIRFLLE